MKRTTPLKADPAKTRAFVQRGRSKLKRGDWRATNPPPRRADKRLPGARGWTQRVFAIYGRQCIVCGARAVHGHHAVARQTILSARHLSPEERALLAYDARQGVPICERCHSRHELAVARIPFERLPAPVVAWALEHGFRSRIMDKRVYPRQAS